MADLDNKIVVTHINIRQSVSILVIKLIVLEIIAAVLLLIFSSVLFNVQDLGIIGLSSTQIFGISSILLLGVVLKMFLTVYVVLLWLNEYYEVRTDEIFHRSGIFFKKTSQYTMSHIKYAEVFQGVFGKLLNYGTVTLFDQRRNRYMDMFLIHNPMRYTKILEDIIPDLDEEKKLVRGKVVEIRDGEENMD